MAQVDTYLVIARFPLDDVVIQCYSSQEEAEQLADLIAAEPPTLGNDLGDSMTAWFAHSAERPQIEDLISVSILRMLGGVVSLGFVYSVDARHE